MSERVAEPTRKPGLAAIASIGSESAMPDSRVEEVTAWRCPECKAHLTGVAEFGDGTPRPGTGYWECGHYGKGDTIPEPVTAYIPPKGVRLVGLTEEEAKAQLRFNRELVSQAGNSRHPWLKGKVIKGVSDKLRSALSQEETPDA